MVMFIFLLVVCAIWLIGSWINESLGISKRLNYLGWSEDEKLLCQSLKDTDWTSEYNVDVNSYSGKKTLNSEIFFYSQDKKVKIHYMKVLDYKPQWSVSHLVNSNGVNPYKSMYSYNGEVGNPIEIAMEHYVSQIKEQIEKDNRELDYKMRKMDEKEKMDFLNSSTLSSCRIKKEFVNKIKSL